MPFASDTTREPPALRRIDVPAEVNVSASYGVTVLNGAAEEAKAFVRRQPPRSSQRSTQA